MLVCIVLFVLFFKQKTAYELRISDWSSDVCSSDLVEVEVMHGEIQHRGRAAANADYFEAASNQPFHQRGLECRRAEAAVVSDRDSRPPGDRDGFCKGPSDRPRVLHIQVVADRASNVVLAKDRGLEPMRRSDRKRPRLNSSHYCATRM